MGRIIALALAQTRDNAEYTLREMGLSDIQVPGEQQQKKTYKDILQLIQEQPQQGAPIPAQPAGPTNPQGTPAQPGPMIPSVMPDPLIDSNLPVALQTTQEWLISDEGLEMRTSNPMAYQNVVLYAKACQQLMKQQEFTQALVQGAMVGKGPGADISNAGSEHLRPRLQKILIPLRLLRRVEVVRFPVGDHMTLTAQPNYIGFMFLGVSVVVMCLYSRSCISAFRAMFGADKLPFRDGSTSCSACPQNYFISWVLVDFFNNFLRSASHFLRFIIGRNSDFIFCIILTVSSARAKKAHIIIAKCLTFVSYEFGEYFPVLANTATAGYNEFWHDGLLIGRCVEKALCGSCPQGVFAF